jgi:hypothetical protein
MSRNTTIVRTNRLLPLLQGPHRKRRLQKFLVHVGTSLPSCYLATYRPADFPLVRYGRHRKRRVQQFFYCCVYSLLREHVYRAAA